MSPSRPAATAFLALGSNLGDRALLMRLAAQRLGKDERTRVVASSSLYATEPVGIPGAPEFLNAALEVRTRRDAESLLRLCLTIELELGRVRAEGPASRTVDIDILLYEDLRLAGERLCLPHPRMRQRAFVLLPLAEIAPHRLLDGRPIAAWAAGADVSGVRRLEGIPGWPPS